MRDRSASGRRGVRQTLSAVDGAFAGVRAGSFGRAAARRGFSFLELLIGLILLSLAFVPLLSVMLAGHSGTQFSVAQSRAFALASDAAEAIGTLDYDQVTQQAVDDLMRMLPVPDQGFVRQVRVFEPEKSVPIAGAPGKFLHYKPISVLVTFPRRGEAGTREETAQITLGFVRSRMEDS